MDNFDFFFNYNFQLNLSLAQLIPSLSFLLLLWFLFLQLLYWIQGCSKVYLTLLKAIVVVFVDRCSLAWLIQLHLAFNFMVVTLLGEELNLEDECNNLFIFFRKTPHKPCSASSLPDLFSTAQSPFYFLLLVTMPLLYSDSNIFAKYVRLHLTKLFLNIISGDPSVIGVPFSSISFFTVSSSSLIWARSFDLSTTDLLVMPLVCERR